MRELIFGPMPDKASPQTHLPAGPWCFSGRERLFPGWDGTAAGEPEEGSFSFPPDPFADGGSMEAYARRANGEAVRLMGMFGKRLNKERGVSYSQDFWEMALGPWLILCVHMFAERQKRVLDLIALYGKLPLRVHLLPPGLPFSFRSSLEFMQHGVLDVDFNHYIFSRMVEASPPPAWELEYGPARPLHQCAGSPLSAAPVTFPGCEDAPESRKGCGYMSPEDRQALRACAEQAAEARRNRPKLKERVGQTLRNLPFPRQKGFSMPECLSLSLSVMQAGKSKGPGSAGEDSHMTSLESGTGADGIDTGGRAGPGDHTLPLSLYTAEPLQWIFPAEEYIDACMPGDLRELPLPAIPRARGKLRGMTAAISQDDGYRLRLAAWREGGGRLFSVQHGANYGNLRSIGGSFFEYRQHAFFTWGWTRHQDYPCNSVPLPHPLVQSLRDGHKEQADTLVLVGTEMLPFLYRLKSRPQAGELAAYRRGKLRFLASLPPELRGKSLYRPYFPSAYSLEDGPFVQRALPGVKLCTGSLEQHMLACRLLVLDHYGTTLHMALAANIPLICFWDRRQWGMENGTETLLDQLAEAEILFPTAEAAAAKAAAVWENVHGWWGGESVQAARLAWVDAYACCLPAGTKRSVLVHLWHDALRGL